MREARRRAASTGGVRAAALVCAAAATFAACRAPARDAPVELVVVVDVDTLRADGLSAYGNPRATTPNFDALAAAGTRFEWAFSQAPYTLPSQVSIITALYPASHGVIREQDRMGAAAWTLAEAFQAAGWRTGAFVDGGYVSRPFGFDQGFETFVDGDRGGLARSEDAIARWLRAGDGRPAFLFVHTYDPHTPYAPPEPFRSRFAAQAPAPSPGFEPTTEALEAIRASQWQPPQRRLADADLAYARALYDGDVAFVDAWFGRLEALLRELGLARRAVVALVSDHGEEFQEHGSLLHEKLYAPVTRVPLVVRAPGGRAGRVVRAAVETVDLMPTLLELAGLEVPGGLDGRSLAAAVRGGPVPAPRPGLADSPFWGEQHALVDEQYHLIVTRQGGRSELFRYRTDPREQTDLAAGEPATVQRLARTLHARLAGLPPRSGVRVPVELDAESAAALRALGYLR